MAKFTAYRSILGNKNFTKTPARIGIKGLYFTLLVAVMLVPGEAMAFEATLPSASSQKLVAVVQLVDETSRNIPIGAQTPVYSYRESGTVTAYPSPETEQGDWSKTRLALKPALPLTLEGEASYYSRAGCLGCSPNLTMANGRPLDDGALTMAIGANLKHLVGRTATVTNLATDMSVDVLITDTGGFYQAKYGNRVADLTIASKQAIGMAGGVGQVKVIVH